MADLPTVKRIEAELEALDLEYRVTIPRLIREAAAQGDISDNAEYQAAKQRQEFVQARIVHLTRRAASLSLINMANIPRDRIGFGSTFTLEDTESGEERVFRLVLPEEVDAARGMISANSPMGRAAISKQENDEVVLTTPSGTRHYLVTRLRTLQDSEE